MAERLDQIIRSGVLQEIQDAFTAITGLEALFVDPNDQPITQPTDCGRLAQREWVVQQAVQQNRGKLLDQPIHARITADGHPLGSLRLTGRLIDDVCRPMQAEVRRLAEQFDIPADRIDAFVEAVHDLGLSRQAEAIRFAHLLTGAIGQMCAQDLQLSQRAEEMTTLYRLSTLLAGQRDLDKLLRTVCRSAASVMGAKAASIRLFDENHKELIPRAVWNLSDEYLSKGPIPVENNALDSKALDGEIVYVADMASDPRVLYPSDAQAEGIKSILITGLIYWGRQLGVMRIYTDTVREFSDYERELLQAIGQLSAGAIENARLDAYRQESERIEQQVQLAADVQRRLLSAVPPRTGPIDVAARYEPCFELGGDFYDIIPFEHSLGLVVGDVVGKGVAASLLMASVRSALRAYVQDVYDLDEIIARVNTSLTHDTRDNEFATVFYGTLDSRTLRLTYCSAGHDPALLLRDGKIEQLKGGGMAIGIDPHQQYDKGLLDLQQGDVLLVYTDGVTDAQDFQGRKFGRDRLYQAMHDMADQSANDLVNHVLWEVRRFIGLHDRTDDITLLAVKIDGEPRSS